jgi:hypothetical protein
MRLFRIRVFLAIVIGAATAASANEGQSIADVPAPSLERVFKFLSRVPSAVT